MTSPSPAASWPLFPEHLTEEQRIGDALAELGELATTPEANIIKLPNVSASMPQLKAAIRELQGKGYALPDYPDDPQTDEERDVRARYDKVKGSAVNPVLREGNSDRRAPAAVKNYARSHPHSMGAWSPRQQDRGRDDGPRRLPLQRAVGRPRRRRHPHHPPRRRRRHDHRAQGRPDGARGRGRRRHRHARRLRSTRSSREQIARAKAEDVLFSVHLKATMMKVSDPIIFGHVVRAFLPEVFETYGADLDGRRAVPQQRPRRHPRRPVRPARTAREIRAAIDRASPTGPRLAMVNSDKGITNLHVPSDVIVDASMPAMIRTSGHMWGPDGEEHDTLAVIPDSSYAGIYQAVIDDCRANGAFDPTTMGSVPNVGLMAQKAEEYGSHDKTFEIAAAGRVEVVDAAGEVLMSPRRRRRRHLARLPDQGRPDPRLGQARRHAGPRLADPGGLLARRQPRPRPQPHRQGRDLPAATTTPTGWTCASCPRSRRRSFSVERIRRGEDTISVTGNVLRDYNTDLFPILELGTQRQDALGRAADERRRALRDRRGRLGAQARAAARRRRTTCAGTASGEFLALAESFRHEADDRQRPRRRARRGARPRDRAPAQREQVAGPPGGADRQPRQPLLAGPLLGRGARASRPRTPSSPRPSRRWPSSSTAQAETSTPS